VDVILVGHRGARGEAPENTIAGFAHARAVGVDRLELDVRLSADDRLVVVHDETVDRTTAATGPVAGFTAAELAGLDARGSCLDWPERVGIPTLDEVLEAIGGCDLAIEVKRDAPARLERVCALLVGAIGRHGIADRVRVSSFEASALEAVRRLAPDLPRVYIARYDAPGDLETALALGCAQADVPLASGSADVVRAAHARGLGVCGWLGNTPEDVRALVAWGVDAITTDYPTTTRATLRALRP
jgi:glycerophosphoryl diester phosphodiesterase